MKLYICYSIQKGSKKISYDKYLDKHIIKDIKNDS